jgi:uncharacterized protein YjiS (DUF1127 family)
MTTECTEIGTRNSTTGLLERLVRALKRELARVELVTELEMMSDALLADAGIARHEIRAFARAAVRNEPMPPQLTPEAPVTHIGSDIWCRATLLRLP